MRRFLLLLSILAPCLSLAADPGKTVSRTRIASVVSECRHYEGAEVVQLGRFATTALKAVARIASLGDSETQEALGLVKGVRSVSILDYEDCSEGDRGRISRKLERALSGAEVLMEAGDSEGRVRIYGVVDERSDQVRDFVLHAPSDYSLICIFGSVSMEAVAKIAAHD